MERNGSPSAPPILRLGSEADGGRPLLRAGNTQGRSKAASNSREVISHVTRAPLERALHLSMLVLYHWKAQKSTQLHYIPARSPLVNDGLAEDSVKLASGTAPEPMM